MSFQVWHDHPILNLEGTLHLYMLMKIQTRLLAIIHILHHRVVYRQYSTPMIANNRSAIEATFHCFCVVFCIAIS